MFGKKECVAMLLAGGQGSRLYALTRKTAKPAVAFGGKYRIIDFPLSNCINSGIDSVGVLTQYQPLELNDYIGNGLPWDLDRIYGGVKILPPYQGHDGADWYRGTANAIYQNIEFIEQYDPEYVLILSGDHIYQMDYAAMLDYHKEKGAACTIAVLEVPLSEASRFGIMSAYDDGTIYKFTEKPKNPDSTKASMGIYVFTKDKLFDYLRADAENPNSSYDFGKNIIPDMLAAGEKMMAYPFKGYWKDVGTIASLWEANMDLLGEKPVLSLANDNWRIYSRHMASAPQFIGLNAQVENSSIAEGCVVEGTVIHSVLGRGVKVARGAVVADSVLLANVTVEEGAKVEYSILAENVSVGEGAVVGSNADRGAGITLIGRDYAVAPNETVKPGAMLEKK